MSLAARRPWAWSGVSGPGARPRNEDYWQAGWVNGTALVVVADGLGGHRDGHLASRAAVRGAFTAAHRGAFGGLREMVARCVEGAEQAVRSEQRRRKSDLASTVALLAARGSEVAWAHCGDTRAYAVDAEGAASRLTVDHSLAMAELAEEERRAADVRSDARRNVLISTLGSDDPLIEVDGRSAAAGEWFALCTDGFWENAEEAMLFAGRAGFPDAGMLIRHVAAANPFEGDNYTLAVLVQRPAPAGWRSWLQTGGSRSTDGSGAERGCRWGARPSIATPSRMDRR